MPAGRVILAGPHLGLARAALDFVIETAAKRGIAYTFYDTQTESATDELWRIWRSRSRLGITDKGIYY
jgi:3-hydroxy-9,10-secoandrosta-1,3,5(10)-triene-9,17-dione monooxygenase